MSEWGLYRVKVVKLSRSLSISGSLASGGHVLKVLLLRILSGLSVLVLHMTAGARSSIVGALSMPSRLI